MERERQRERGGGEGASKRYYLVYWFTLLLLLLLLLHYSYPNTTPILPAAVVMTDTRKNEGEDPGTSPLAPLFQKEQKKKRRTPPKDGCTR